MSIAEIERRLAVDGFPELERHWRKFLSQSQSGDPPPFDQLMARTRRHTQVLLGRPLVVMLTTMLFAAPVAWIYAQSTATAMQQRGLFSESVWILIFIATWATLNLGLLMLYCIMLVQRYCLSPLEPLLADWTGWMLTQESLRSFLRNAKRIEHQNTVKKSPFIALDWEACNEVTTRR